MTEFNTPAENSSNYDFDTITSVPSIDIARWAARINLINYALDQNESLDNGDMVGYMYSGLTEFAKEGGDWHEDPALETLAIAEMKPSLTFDKVMNGPTRYSDNPRYAEGKNVSMDIQRGALRKGLGRLGLYGASEPRVPLEAAAALHYLRGNIKDPIDRKLYDRATEIDEAAGAIGAAVQARMTERIVLKPRGPDGPHGKVRTPETTTGTPLTKKEKETLHEIGLTGGDENSQHDPVLFEEVSHPMSVYMDAAYLTADEARALGLDLEARMSPWWQELQNDLARVDAASTQL